MAFCLALVLSALFPAITAAAKPGEPIQLSLQPAAAPKPSLQYRLLPDPRDRTPGNAATLYYRSGALFLENHDLLLDIKAEHWSQWLEVPSAKLPRQEVSHKLTLARHLLREIELAGRCRHCDWQLEGRSEGAGLLLPEVQTFRQMGTVLAVKARLEIGAGRWAEAAQTLQTGYALARNLARGPTLIHVLVGAAVANLLTSQLEEWVQQPNAPNLYWALTTLPHPLLDPDSAVTDESNMLERSIPNLKRLEGGPAPIAQVQAVLLELGKTLDDFGLRRPDQLQTTAQAVLMVQAHPEAKRFLLANGYTAEQIESMPIPQAVLLFAFGKYRQSWEEAAKWAHVADGFRQPGYRAARAEIKEAVQRLDRIFFRGLLQGLEAGEPALENVYGAIRRLDRRLAALRCIEAIRLYAAAHDGKLPAALADSAEAPAPADPITGKPFEYKAADDRATLTTPLPPGPKPPAAQLLSYELTLRR